MPKSDTSLVSTCILLNYLCMATGCKKCDPENIDFNKVAKQMRPAENFDEKERVRFLEVNTCK